MGIWVDLLVLHTSVIYWVWILTKTCVSGEEQNDQYRSGCPHHRIENSHRRTERWYLIIPEGTGWVPSGTSWQKAWFILFNWFSQGTHPNCETFFRSHFTDLSPVTCLRQLHLGVHYTTYRLTLSIPPYFGSPTYRLHAIPATRASTSQDGRSA